MSNDQSAGSPCHVKDIKTEEEFASYTSDIPSTTLLVIYFQAAWAEPCKQMSTVLSALASTYTVQQPPKISFLSLDAEEVSDTAEDYNVTQVPFIALQRDGKVVDTVIGTDASAVRSAVEKYAGPTDSGADKAGLPPAQKVTKQEGTKAAPATSAGVPDAAPKYTSGEGTAETSPEELNGRLGELVKAAPVMLFMKGTPSAPQCGFSRQTVGMLREKGVRYGFFNILADDEVRQGLKEFSDWPTFPQIYVGGELIGGLDIVSFVAVWHDWSHRHAWVDLVTDWFVAQGGVCE